eukprot:7385172-Prymnesium_polylepis.1
MATRAFDAASREHDGRRAESLELLMAASSPLSAALEAAAALRPSIDRRGLELPGGQPLSRLAAAPRLPRGGVSSFEFEAEVRHGTHLCAIVQRRRQGRVPGTLDGPRLSSFGGRPADSSQRSEKFGLIGATRSAPPPSVGMPLTARAPHRTGARRAAAQRTALQYCVAQRTAWHRTAPYRTATHRATPPRTCAVRPARALCTMRRAAVRRNAWLPQLHAPLTPRARRAPHATCPLRPSRHVPAAPLTPRARRAPHATRPPRPSRHAPAASLTPRARRVPHATCPLRAP